MAVKKAITHEKDERIPPRSRLLAVAGELFYRHGIRAVGVESIAEAAGTNKMTLYRHFASKDELVAAYLGKLAAEGEAIWEQARAAHPGDPQAQLRYLMRRVSQFAAESTGRGCALANAAVELAERKHPARKVVEAHKRRQCERLIALCREAGYAEPARIAEELFLLVEGARVSLQSVGAGGPGMRLYALAEGLLDAAPKRKRLKTA
jgi:AcrR family transcriptional regulator